MLGDFAQKLLLAVITALLAMMVTFFGGSRQELLIIAYVILAIGISFGIWTINARRHRKEREEKEEEYRRKKDEEDRAWKESLMKRLDRADEADRAILRNELVKAHREWVEKKGYITLESLEVLSKVHIAYNNVGANDIGDKLWNDIMKLPLEEHRTHPEVLGDVLV